MSLWESELLSFIDRCSIGAFERPSEAIRTMVQIIDDAPDHIAPLISPRAEPQRIDALLDIDAPVSAAMELIGPLCGILVSQSPIGAASGLVKIVDEIEEANFFAADPAVALMGAYGTALISVLAHIRETAVPNNI